MFFCNADGPDGMKMLFTPKSNMEHANAALWTIPNYDLVDVYKFCLNIPNIVSSISNSKDPDQKVTIIMSFLIGRLLRDKESTKGRVPESWQCQTNI